MHQRALTLKICPTGFFGARLFELFRVSNWEDVCAALSGLSLWWRFVIRVQRPFPQKAIHPFYFSFSMWLPDLFPS